MKRLDLVLIVVVLVAAGLCYLFYMGGAVDGAMAVVRVDGTVVKELPLSEDTQYTVETPQGINVIEIKDGHADVIEADCPDGVCTEHKTIQKTGETIVCLPHKMVVTIEDGEAQEIDAVVE